MPAEIEFRTSDAGEESLPGSITLRITELSHYRSRPHRVARAAPDPRQHTNDCAYYSMTYVLKNALKPLQVPKRQSARTIRSSL